jgi:hypothetical protein
MRRVHVRLWEQAAAARAAVLARVSRKVRRQVAQGEARYFILFIYLFIYSETASYKISHVQTRKAPRTEKDTKG